MAALQTALLVAVAAGVALVALLLLLVLRRVGRTDREALGDAFGEALREAGFDDRVALIQDRADRIAALHEDIESMLAHPQQRGSFGEQQLEAILEEHVPPDMVAIREQLPSGGTPDAAVEAPMGRICIDAKFPLDNYRAAVEADGDGERAEHLEAFRSDAADRLREVAERYVRPEEGTAAFAFAYVPSERVYHHLATEEHDLLREYVHEGVQVVSPLTLGHKLELIRADVRAQQLSEQAEAIRDDLAALDDGFASLGDELETLLRHTRNANAKARDVDDAFTSLRSEFVRIDNRVEGVDGTGAEGLDDADGGVDGAIE